VPLVVLVIGAFFMLVEKMAVHLQDPFENKPTDTPMTAISHGIEKDLRQMLNDHHEPLASTRVSKKKDYFLM
jgi:putative membrane protein